MSEENVPLISIIIPTYNSSRTIRHSLDSISNRSNKDVEIIIVDDGSVDNTVKIAEGFGCRIINLNGDQGLATARNTGAQQAKGEILLFVDSDILLKKEILQRLVEHFKNSDSYVIQAAVSAYCPYKNFSSQYKNLVQYYRFSKMSEFISTVMTTCLAVKRKIFLKTEGFDLNFKKPTIEDFDFATKLLRAGYKIYLDKQLEYVHMKYFNFWKLIKHQYQQSKGAIKFILRTRCRGVTMKKNEFANKSTFEILRIPLVYLILLSLILNIFWKGLFLFATILFVIIFIISLDFLKCIKKKKGLKFAIKCFFMGILDSFVCGLGALVGFLEYVVFRKYY
ncbi:MAG: glycosyltransferase family 2 protein [Candidatus Omnitrophota bacterium]|nr:glycosyltransferase family 2 protein [Candidatus Omnitrophota bacterium]